MAALPEEQTGLLRQSSGNCFGDPPSSRNGLGSRRIVAVAVTAGLLLSMSMLLAASHRSTTSQPRAFRPAQSSDLSFEVKAEADGQLDSLQDDGETTGGGQPGNLGVPGFGGVNLGQGFGAIGNAVKHLLGEPSEEEKQALEKRKEQRMIAEEEATIQKREEERAMIKAHKEEEEQEKQALQWIKQKRKDQKKALEKAKREADEEAEKEKAQKAAKRLEEKRHEEENIKDMKEALEKARKEKARRQKEEEEERKKCLAEKNKTDAMKVTLYCFSLMMPFGYEPSLLATQRNRTVGIFDCDGYDVFSNTTTVLSTGKRAPIDLKIMNGSLAVQYGGKWGTALNTGVFNRLWTEVIHLARYRLFDWTVKVDPDAVFFPSRLRMILKRRTPLNTVRMHGDAPAKIDCSTCKLAGHKAETCSWRVQSYQAKGKSCADALTAAARPPPDDCGCVCDDFACNLPATDAMYLNNCKWGLHGPIEVFSRRAVASYIAGLPQCISLLEHPWGEDKFVDQCMQKLGVTRENEYDLLSETACGEQPAPCGSSDVAFHPFKSIDSYFACWSFADRYGKGPEDLDCRKKEQLPELPEVRVQTDEQTLMKK